MPTFKIVMTRRGPQSSVEVYKDKDNGKQAYNYAMEYGTEIFGEVPDCVAVIEQEPDA